MIATATSNLRQQLYQLIDRLSDEKILSLYHYATYLAQLDSSQNIEEPAIVVAEDAAQIGEHLLGYAPDD